MRAEDFRCADSAEERDEPLFGTASFVRRWLLIEQSGSWGPNALTQSRIPIKTALELRRRARAARIRVILIRRGVRFSSDKRQCYFLRTDEREQYQSQLELDSIDELLDVDFAPSMESETIAGTERHAPLFLVCTHGRHDACCSIRGNLISRLACAHPGLEAWECSHIGGDRFAATLVCFPHGIYYGRVGSRDVGGLMNGYAEGVVSLDHYRGRCCYPFSIQAAESFARRETGTTAVDAMSLLGQETTNRGSTAEFLIDGERRVTVELAITSFGEHRLTCNSKQAEPIPRYELISCNVRMA